MIRNVQKSKIITVAVVFALIAVLVLLSQPQVLQVFSTKRQLPIYSVKKEEKVIAISFDCAWGTEHTDDILEALEKFNVPATFFAVEFWVKKYPDYCKKIVESGHEMGTHSSTHSHMSKMSASAVREELISSSAAIKDATGQEVRLFRCPFGEYNDDVITVANSLNLQVIQWDVDSLDWKDLTSGEISLRIINKVKPGSIILCHNNGLHTAEALPIIFADLQNKGYKFVKISELIYFENYQIDANGVQSPLN